MKSPTYWAVYFQNVNKCNLELWSALFLSANVQLVETIDLLVPEVSKLT